MALNSIFVCVIISTVLSGFIAPIADAGPTQCHACIGSTAAFCTASQQTQVCATDVNSLGTTHCGTAVGKYRDRNGQVHEGFIRGCINCADKKAACFAIGGALKAREVWTLLQCEIECCTDNNCNTQSPTLSQAAITVFTGGSGPKECNVCVERDQATCTSNQQSQTCASDPNSLGTTHCGTAVGKVRDKDGNIIEGIIRGCIDCADKKAACFALGGAMKARENWNLQQCELECCTGNKCNTQTPSLSPGAVPVFQPAGDTKPTASGRGGQQVLLSEILAFAIAFAYILYHFL